MDDEQLRAAERLRTERKEIRYELETWEQELTHPNKLGYLAGWNNNHPCDLKSRVPAEIFDCFRTAAMAALRLRLLKAEQEFEEL